MVESPREKTSMVAARMPESSRLIDGFVWGEEIGTLWRPEGAGALAALMRYDGRPAWTDWPAGQGEVLSSTIQANRVELEVDVTETAAGEDSARLVIHDAYWPSWRAWVDEQEIALRPMGLWRSVEVPAGRHVVKMAYRPRLVGKSLMLEIWVVIALILLCRPRRTRSRDV